MRIRWAIRNSGLILLNSLLRRLNGGTDTKSSRASSSRRQFSSLAYGKYLNLPKLILILLFSSRPRYTSNMNHQVSSVSATVTTQKAFLAFEIIERFGLPEDHRLEIGNLVQEHMGGPVWSIREKAAKAFAFVVPEREIAIESERMLEDTRLSQNELHGRLLCIRQMFSRVAPSIPTLLSGRIPLPLALRVEH